MIRDISRLKQYSFSFIFTSIALIDVYKTDFNDEENADVGERGEVDNAFGVALSLLSLLAIGPMMLAHMHPLSKTYILGTKLEALFVFLIFVFSVITCAIESGPARGISVDKYGALENGNIFYFSWLAFFNALRLVLTYLRDAEGIDFVEKTMAKSTSFKYWFALALSSMIILGSSVELHRKNCVDDKEPEPYCSRTAFGITSGVVGTLCASFVTGMHIFQEVPFIVEVIVSAGLIVLYLVEVALITDNRGPGAPVGTLYYVSWISFLLSVKIEFACHDIYVEAKDLSQKRHDVVVEPMVTRSESDDGGKTQGNDPPPSDSSEMI